MFDNWRKVSTPRSGSVSYPIEISQCRIFEQMWVAKGSITYELRDANGRRIGLKAPYDGFVHPFLAVGQTLDSSAIAFYITPADEGSELDSQGHVHNAANADRQPRPEEEIAEEDQWREEELGEELANGTRLSNGQFVIKRFIAAGGFGITYFAEDNLGRSVVVKECFPAAISRRNEKRVTAATRDQQATLAKCIRLFVKEARVLARLSHPNIVGVKGCFEENNTAYMVLERVHGHDIDWNIDNNREALTPEFVSFLARTMLETLGVVHAAGMLHRDVSPGNIMIDMESKPVLIDFGAARAEVTKASRAVSTHPVVKDGYSPNELYITGALQTPATDLYALAGTLFHVITGNVPTAADMRQHMVQNGEADPYVPLVGRFPEHEPALLAAIDKSMSLRMADRCQSAAEWQKMLDDKTSARMTRKGADQRGTAGKQARSPDNAKRESDTATAPSLTAFLATVRSRQNAGSVNKTPLVPPEVLSDWVRELVEKAQMFQNSGKAIGVLTPDDFTVSDGKHLALRLDFRPADLGSRIERALVPAAVLPHVAPELVEANAPVSGASDVFTIATILFACLTGRPPAPGTGRKIPATLFGPKPMMEAIEAALSEHPAKRPSLDGFIRFAMASTRDAERAEKTSPKPEATADGVRSDPVPPADPTPISQPRQPGKWVSWITLVMTGMLIPLMVGSIYNVVTFDDPLFSFGVVRDFIENTLGVEQEFPWFTLAPLLLCGVLYAMLTRRVRKLRAKPDGPVLRRTPIVAGFLLGSQIIPIAFSEQFYTETAPIRITLLCLGLGLLFALAAFFIFRPRTAG